MLTGLARSRQPTCLTQFVGLARLAGPLMSRRCRLLREVLALTSR